MIYGERIRLRHIERTDLPRFVDWFNDPEVRQGLSRFLPLSMAEEEDWFDNILKREAVERPLAIEARGANSPAQNQGHTSAQDWIMIGNSGFFNFEWRNRSAELGIMIGDKDYWNKGYGTETLRLLLRHGFDTLNLHRIYLRVFEDNPRAIRAYQKAGFTLEGRLRQAEFHDGKYLDVLVMSILKSEWKE